MTDDLMPKEYERSYENGVIRLYRPDGAPVAYFTEDRQHLVPQVARLDMLHRSHTGDSRDHYARELAKVFRQNTPSREDFESTCGEEAV